MKKPPAPRNFTEWMEAAIDGRAPSESRVSLMQYDQSLARCLKDHNRGKEDFIVVEEYYFPDISHPDPVQRTLILTLDEFCAAFAPELKHLSHLRWMLDKEGRESIEIIQADLRRDVRQMSKEEHSTAFIRRMIRWRSICSVLPLIWDRTWRLIFGLAPLEKLIRAVKGWW